MPILNEEEAIALFCAATTKQAEATETGEYKVGNAAYAQLVEALKWLEDKHKIQRIQPLLAAPSVGTRLWTAAYLLTTGNTEAEAILVELALLDNIHGFTAKMTLREWRAGRLKPLV